MQDVHVILSQDCYDRSSVQQEKALFTNKLDLNLRKQLVKFYICSISLYGAEPWTLGKADNQYLGSFKALCWGRMEISCTDRVRNEELLRRVEEEGTSCFQ